MERLLLTLSIIMLLFTPTLKSEVIEVTTPAQQQTITFNPNKERSTDLEDTNLPNSVESILPDSSNGRAVNGQNELQGYVGQPMYPVYPVYKNGGGYFYPGVNPNAVAPATSEATNYFASVLPAAQMGFEVLRQLFLYFLVRHFINKLVNTLDLVLNLRDILIPDELSTFLTEAALQAALKVFAKLGLYLMGGAGLLVVGGIITFLLCYLTPVCTLSFRGFDFQQTLNKDTMRSLMTPEKIASAAALVQDAIGKYQKLQKTVGQ